MLISDLIKRLQDAKAIHGDLPVAGNDVMLNDWLSVTNVTVRHKVELGPDSDITTEFFVGIDL